MRGNPDGSLSSPGRFATGLLSLRYIDGIFVQVLLATLGSRWEQSRGWG